MPCRMDFVLPATSPLTPHPSLSTARVSEGAMELTDNACGEGVIDQSTQVGGEVEDKGGGAGGEEVGEEDGVGGVWEGQKRSAFPVEHHKEQGEGQGPAVVVEQKGEGVQLQLLPQLAHDDHICRRGKGRGQRQDVACNVESQISHTRNQAPKCGHVH